VIFTFGEYVRSVSKSRIFIDLYLSRLTHLHDTDAFLMCAASSFEPVLEMVPFSVHSHLFLMSPGSTDLFLLPRVVKIQSIWTRDQAEFSLFVCLLTAFLFVSGLL